MVFVTDQIIRKTYRQEGSGDKRGKGRGDSRGWDGQICQSDGTVTNFALIVIIG